MDCRSRGGQMGRSRGRSGEARGALLSLWGLWAGAFRTGLLLTDV